MTTKFHRRRPITVEAAQRAEDAVNRGAVLRAMNPPPETSAPVAAAPDTPTPVTVAPVAAAPVVAGAASADATLVARQDPAYEVTLVARQGLAEPSSTWKVGQVIHVPLSRIQSNPWNPRVVYRPSAIDEMAQSLQQHGQQVPVLGYWSEDSQNIVLIDGETRFRAARIAGLDTLRVEVHPQPATPRALYELARTANVNHNDPTPLDDAWSWRRLLDSGLYPSQAELARALRVQEALVSRKLSLCDLPAKYSTIIAEYPGLLHVRVLDALRRYWEVHGDVALLALIHKAGSEELGYREIEALRLGKPHKASGPRPKYSKIAVSFHDAKGDLKTFSDGRLQLSLVGLTADQAERLQERLRSALKEDRLTEATDSAVDRAA